MKIPFFSEKKKEDRSVVRQRLGVVKKSARDSEATKDVQKLVKGIADGDSG